MRFRLPVLTFAFLGAMAACSKPSPSANNAAAPDLPPPAGDANPDPAGGPPDNAVENHAGTPAATDPALGPPSLQGRGGPTPGDVPGPLDSAKAVLVSVPDQQR